MRLRTPLCSFTLAAAAVAATAVASTGCGSDGDDHDHGNEQEVITTVILTFTPAGGGAAIVAVADDPDGDGGDPPVIDDVALFEGTSYDVTVAFENRLEDPAEDITAEVADEAEDHQVFFTGTAVNGPASDRPTAGLTHAYADEDANGLPIGLASTIDVVGAGGELTITLRHLPPVNDVAAKTATTAADVAAGGFAAIGGTTDAQVTFEVAVAVE
jgi:hypothetical protein